MIQTSDKWKQYYKDGGVFAVRATFVDGNGVTMDLTGEDFMSLRIDDSISDTMSFRIGTAISSVLTVTLNNVYGRFDYVEFGNSQITLEFGALYDDGTEEWIQRGVYFPERPRTMGFTIELTCYDAMVKLDRPFSDVSVTYPMLAVNFVYALLYHCGVEEETIGLITGTITASKMSAVDPTSTCRDVLQMLMETQGLYAKIDANGKFNICKYTTYLWKNGMEEQGNGGTFSPWSASTAIDGGSFSPWDDDTMEDGGLIITDDSNLWDIEHVIESKVDVDEIQYSGVIVYYDSEGHYDYQRSGYTPRRYFYAIENNSMITNADTAEIAVEVVLDVLEFVRVRAFETTIFGDPSMETGDWVIIRDYKEESYLTLITNLTYSADGTTTISLGAETPEELRMYDPPQTRTRALAKSAPANVFSGTLKAGETEKICEYTANNLIVVNAHFDKVGVNRITVEDNNTSVSDGLQDVNLSHIANGTASIYAYSDTDNEVVLTIQERR